MITVYVLIAIYMIVAIGNAIQFVGNDDVIHNGIELVGYTALFAIAGPITAVFAIGKVLGKFTK